MNYMIVFIGMTNEEIYSFFIFYLRHSTYFGMQIIQFMQLSLHSISPTLRQSLWLCRGHKSWKSAMQFM